MKNICVYTCITGNYDNVHEIENKEKGLDYYLFTNNRNIKSNTWKVVYIEDETLNNHQLSRKIKMLGHPIINENYDISVWMDASVVFKNSIVEFVEKYFDITEAPFSAFRHSERNCIYEEAKACAKFRKDSKENIKRLIAFLKSENYPKNNGLYEMTVFIKAHNDPVVKETMELWFKMLCNYSKRDQLSFMYCAYKTGMKIKTIERSVWDNDYFYWVKHVVAEKIGNYRVYFGDDEKSYSFNKDIQGVYQQKDNTYIIDIKIPCDTDLVKVEVSRCPYVIYRNIKVKGISPNNIKVENSIHYYDDTVFYNDKQFVMISGNFKKNKRFYFEIELLKLDVYLVTDYLREENDKLLVHIEEQNNLMNNRKKNNIFHRVFKIIKNSVRAKDQIN